MAENSGIAWTNHTFNSWIGCTKVSEGCQFCYAEKWDRVRFSQTTNKEGHLRDAHWGPNVPRYRTSLSNRNKPRVWNNQSKKSGIRAKVFCSSLSDIFDAEIPLDWRAEMFAMVKECTHLDWLLLTKRIENAKNPGFLPADWGQGYPNAWIGTTTENQKWADIRIPILAEIPAVVRFISIEPQIENIDFSKWLKPNPPFDWMIFGGESGSERPFDPEWARFAFDEAPKQGVAVFMKQMGSRYAHEKGLKNKKGDDPAEWPEWARRREFPKPRTIVTEAAP